MMKLTKQIAKWLIAEFPAKLFDRPLPPLTPEDSRLIEEFRSDIAKQTSEVQKNPNITPFWKQTALRFEKAVRERDPREFLRWEECLPFRAGPGVLPQFLALKKSHNWRSKWQAVLEDGPTGRQHPFFLYPKVGPNIILHAHHIERFEKFSGKPLADFGLIVEFGGGYGGLCRLIHKVGFAGRYLIFDLPQQNVLQRYYLKSSKMPVLLPNVTGAGNGITLINEISGLVRLFADAKQKTNKPSLFIANWSLSESPTALRQQISDEVIRHCDFFLINYQDSFQEVDNVAYFETWRKQHQNLFIVEQEQMPMRKPADYYFLGKPKEINPI